LQAVLDRKNATLPEQSGRSDTPRQQAGNSREQRAASRHGLHLIGGHFSSEVVKQLRILAAEEETTIQSLLGEAIDDLFVKKGKSRLLSV
jgi:hypothetical protein